MLINGKWLQLPLAPLGIMLPELAATHRLTQWLSLTPVSIYESKSQPLMKVDQLPLSLLLLQLSQLFLSTLVLRQFLAQWYADQL